MKILGKRETGFARGTRYARFVDERNIVTSVPRKFVDEDGRVYSGDLTVFPAIMEKLGYLPVEEDEPIEPQEGYHVEERYSVEEDVDGQYIRVSYEEVKNPDPVVPVRHFSKLRLKTELAKRGLLQAFNAAISGIEIAPGYSASEAWADAQVLSDDFDGFYDIIGRIVTGIGSDMETANAILDAAESWA